jgi:hypothetical protein
MRRSISSVRVIIESLAEEISERHAKHRGRQDLKKIATERLAVSLPCQT